MRFSLVGIIYLYLVSQTLAGVIGRVTSIGFDSFIRADCTVPMVVQITSDAAVPENYTLQVVQYDRDGDEVAYSRPVVVNPGDQSFWTYFKPESINGGLPSQGVGTAAELAKRLRVFLATADGSKRLVQISAAGRMPAILDYDDRAAGNKLVLCVGRRPNVNEFDPSTTRVLGLRESMMVVPLETRRLPDNVLGYEAVDAVVWTDADPEPLDASQFRALRQYIRGGGRLVVIQNAEVARMARLDEFLPVRVTRVEEFPTLEPLKSILQPRSTPVPVDPKTEREIFPFTDAKGPFRMARATALPNAIVDEDLVQWPDGSKSPFIVRHLFGQGMVAWIAQDISDPSVRDISHGWPRFWNRAMDWQIMTSQIAFPSVATRKQLEFYKRDWQSGGDKDLGAAFVENLDLSSKTAALISLAFVFFVGYWLIAGPGMHIVLAMKQRTQWSWFIFGAIALIATLLTAAVAQLVLRGSPQIRHVSLVRATSDGNDPARIFSRFGIYVPRDESNLPVTLTNRDTAGATLISPLSVAPRYSSQNVAPRDAKYTVPLTNEDAGEEISVGVPFRSTLKKLQADWTGPLPGRIGGRPMLSGPESNIAPSGSLSNNTGRDLTRVLIVFNSSQDFFIYRRVWMNGETIQLDSLWNKADTAVGQDTLLLPLNSDLLRGRLRFAAGAIYRDGRMRTNFMSAGDSVPFNDSDQDYRYSFPIVSLFDRLAPMINENEGVNRVDLLRRGVRNWDCSAAIAGGAMVILAQSSNDTTPLPLTVGGATPEGTGTTFWQFILPLDRSGIIPTTQPTESKESD